MSHLSRIAAAGYDVQVFEAEAFIAALDDSGDLPSGYGMERFDDMLVSKYMEADPLLIADLNLMGIEQPLLVDVEDDGTWTFVDGHHRLAWAVVAKAPVPVIFVTIDMDAIALYEAMLPGEVFYDNVLTL